ncbi:MAG: RES family NAD+ phosphorylase [Deltaproteobacteria bacterium]|nr:MAG: RES family NAD+ phosphorylase [Deltaproteobacteria bacterium]
MKYKSTLSRIVELQAHTVVRQLTDTQEEYEWLENLIETTKPKPLSLQKKHYLIATPFRYPLPIPPLFEARFRPAFFERNAFYGTQEDRTSYYEYAYHWMLQRVHIKNLSQIPEPRSLFHVNFEDKNCTDIRKTDNIGKIMDRHDYGASHAFVKEQTKLSSILYPSCRDPQGGNCLVTFEPETLGDQPIDMTGLFLIYFTKTKTCQIENPMTCAKLIIHWQEIS